MRFKIFLTITAIVAATTTLIGIFSVTATAGQGFGMWAGGCNNFRHDLGPKNYQFSVDISEDVFVNPGRFGQITGGMHFIDENEDGICDIVQDSAAFAELGIGEFVDENDDGICDIFQTRQMYRALGMNNFVDSDGDGICDNYEKNRLFVD